MYLYHTIQIITFMLLLFFSDRKSYKLHKGKNPGPLGRGGAHAVAPIDPVENGGGALSTSMCSEFICRESVNLHPFYSVEILMHYLCLEKAERRVRLY